MFDLTTISSQKGKIAIVTGANAGIGFETALVLAQLDFTVIMACRNAEKAEKAKNTILSKIPKAHLEIMPLDLSRLKSVRTFAENFLANYSKLDLLINNAGIMIPPFSKTEDGFESQMAANYFGHFLLTGLLLKTIIHTPDSRIVALSSVVHRRGKINFENLNAEKSYSKIRQYAQSKLACLMFALELDRKFAAHNIKTLAVCAHPGVANTELLSDTHPLMQKFFAIFTSFTHSPTDAALPSLMAALDKNVKSGSYFGPDGFRGFRGKPQEVKANAHAYDKEVAKKLWQISEKLTGFSYSFD